jgi:hypothetical protein
MKKRDKIAKDLMSQGYKWIGSRILLGDKFYILQCPQGVFYSVFNSGTVKKCVNQNQ